MDTKTKINLGAIMKGHDNHIKSNAPPEDNIENTNSTNTISIGNETLNETPIIQDGKDQVIKNELGLSKGVDSSETVKNEEIIKIEDNVEENIKNEEKLEKKPEIEVNGEEKSETEEIKVAENTSGKHDKKPKRKVAMSLNDIKNDIKEEEDEKEEKQKKEENDKKVATLQKNKKKNKKDDSKGELFTNYEATFTERKDHIVESVKKLKTLPKTRPIFLSSLIVIAISGIGLLFYIDPKNHSLDNYKTSIINILPGTNNLLYESGTVNVENDLNIVVYEKEKVRIGGLNFEIETGTINNNKILKYNGKIYNSQEELENDISSEVQEIKKEKLINELMKFF